MPGRDFTTPSICSESASSCQVSARRDGKASGEKFYQGAVAAGIPVSPPRLASGTLCRHRHSAVTPWLELDLAQQPYTRVGLEPLVPGCSSSARRRRTKGNFEERPASRGLGLRCLGRPGPRPARPGLGSRCPPQAGFLRLGAWLTAPAAFARLLCGGSGCPPTAGRPQRCPRGPRRPARFYQAGLVLDHTLPAQSSRAPPCRLPWKPSSDASAPGP